MVRMMDVRNTLEAYAILGDKIAAEWVDNDFQIKRIAIGCEDVAKDLGLNSLADAVAFFLESERLIRESEREQ